MDKQFQQIRDIQAGLELADQQKERLVKRKCSWDDPQDVALYRSSIRGAERERILNRLVGPSRICPECGNTIMSSRSWVISKEQEACLCRSCFMLQREDMECVCDKILFTKPVTRYEVDGFGIQYVREEADVGKQTFAREAGWSRQYQGQLEDGTVQTVTKEVAETILKTFASIGITTEDCL